MSENVQKFENKLRESEKTPNTNIKGDYSRSRTEDVSNEVSRALGESLESLEGGGNRAGEHGQTGL